MKNDKLLGLHGQHSNILLYLHANIHPTLLWRMYGGRLSACCVWFYLVDFRRFIGHSRVCIVIFCIK